MDEELIERTSPIGETKSYSLAEDKPMVKGGVLFVLAVIVCILNLQAPLTSIAPVATEISYDMKGFDLGFTGSLPIIIFIISGLFVQRFEWWFTTEKAVAISLFMIAVGQLLRALTSSFLIFIATSSIALMGIGFSYALLPPLFKKYTPNHVGPLTAAYSALRAVSSGLPALIAVSLLNKGGWRLAIGVYAVPAALAVLPWILLSIRVLKATGNSNYSIGKEPLKKKVLGYSSLKWTNAWALGITVGVAFFLDFSFLTFLPGYLSSVGYEAQTANSMVALYSVFGIIHSMIVPVVLSKMKKPYLIMKISTACYMIAILGFLFAPGGGLSWLWVIFACEGNMVIPGYLRLINMRTRTTEGSTNLAAFTITLGYLIAVFGPILFGALLNTTNGYFAPFVMCLVIAVVILISGRKSVEPVFLEDMNN